MPAPSPDLRAAESAEATAATITGAELVALLARDESVVVLEIGDLRNEADLSSEHARGHIPGAAYVSFEDELRGERTGANGSGPLPSPLDLERRIRSWGIDRTTPVVVYGRGRPGPQTRAWFVLRWAGLTDVRYLDGGYRAWLDAGGAVSTEVRAAHPSSFEIAPGSVPTLTVDEAAAFPAHGVLVDARGAAQYAGDPAQPERTGHIPGAVSVPNDELRTADGALRPEDELRELFRSRGVDGSRPVGVYCGGGVGATYDLLALHTLGIPAAVYVGSWSNWIQDPSRPVAQGA